MVRGDKLLFYYTGFKYRGRFNYVGKYPNVKRVPNIQLDPAIGAICLAVLRRDGFISLDAKEKQGYVLTSAFTRPVGRLHVNADIKQGGRLQIELLNKDDQVIATSKPLEGNQLRGGVEWPALADQAYVGKTVRLKFTLTQGSLYSYWFAKPDTVSTGGASNDE